MPITRRKRANPPDQPEDNNHAAQQTEHAAESLIPDQAATDQGENTSTPVTDHTISPSFSPVVPPMPGTGAPTAQVSNGVEQQNYIPPIEGGRRTVRGELFRRPPQPPPVPVTPSPSPLQAPTHEIALPLGNLLHLAYNPGYTGSDEARSVLLNQLANESKAGGRARCWNCGSIAIAYDRWVTRSKTFGEVGIAFCEICGVWSVL